MTSTEDLERHLYRAISGNRLSHRTATVDGAIREVQRRFGKEAPAVLGISRETWRRWLKPSGQRPRPGTPTHGGLLAVLRRLRLSPAREAKIRAGGITLRLFSSYEQISRTVGPQTLGWTPAAADRLLDAYLTHGIERAAQEWLRSIGPAHFAEWLAPEAHGSRESYDITGMDLTDSPPRGAGTRDSED